MEALRQVNTNVAGSADAASTSTSVQQENMPKVVDIATFNDHVHLVDDLDGSDGEGSPSIHSRDISNERADLEEKGLVLSINPSRPSSALKRDANEIARIQKRETMREVKAGVMAWIILLGIWAAVATVLAALGLSIKMAIAIPFLFFLFALAAAHITDDE